MIEMKPVKVITPQIQALCPDIGGNAVFYLAATDKDKLLGVGAVRLETDWASLLAIRFLPEYDAPDLQFGMGKALLNFIDRREIRFVACSDKTLAPLLERLRFRVFDGTDAPCLPPDTAYYLDLTGYFDAHCKTL